MTGTPLTEPIDRSTAQSFSCYEDLKAYHDGFLHRQRYGRDSSSTLLAVEEEIERAWGRGFRALLFSSGMAAITAVLDVLMDDGRALYVPNEHYRKLQAVTGARWNVVHYRTIEDIRITGPSLLWLETPSNPHLRLPDYDAIAALKQEHGDDLFICADLTLAGLDNFRAPQLLDAEIHSATKYIGGHNDLIAGLALIRGHHYPRLWDRRSFAGGILDPDSAFLLARSLKTYALRMTRQVSTAQDLASALVYDIAGEASVFYPAFGANQEDRRRFRFYHRHAGAVISALVPGVSTPEALTDRAGSLRHFKMAPNFGATESLIEVPATMSHYGKTPEELARSGIEPNLVRISVGLEPYGVLLEDLMTLFS